MRHWRSSSRVFRYSGVLVSGAWPKRPPLITCGGIWPPTFTSSMFAAPTARQFSMITSIGSLPGTTGTGLSDPVISPSLTPL